MRLLMFGLLASFTVAGVALGSDSLEHARLSRPSVRVLSFGATEPVSVRPVYAQDKDWLRDFSLEVQNTSGRPIYYIEYGLVLTNPQDGAPYLFYLSQGRKELLAPTRPAAPADRPIQPGETVTLRIPTESYSSFENYLKLKMWSITSFRQAQLAIQSINFGDGTGWQGGQMRTQETEMADAFTRVEPDNLAASSCGYTYRRIPSGPAECLQCDAPSIQQIGPGNERAISGRVVCTDESGRTITCFGFMVFPCNI
jgi:hypothetical protein